MTSKTRPPPPFTGDTNLRVLRYGSYSLVSINLQNEKPYVHVKALQPCTDIHLAELQLSVFRGEVFANHVAALECATAVQKWLDENFEGEPNETV